MCGEKHQQPKAATAGIGSPPHVRGKVDENINGVVLRGITPACAGKRIFPTEESIPHQDHPRMCGEKGRSQIN